jgi:hypothetical protein
VVWVAAGGGWAADPVSCPRSGEVILRDGAKFHQLTIPPSEGQMSETRNEQVRDVARFLNLAPSRLGATGGGGYNSQLEDNQRYLDSCLAPWLAAIAAECRMKLLSQAQKKNNSHYFRHVTDDLLNMNPLTRAQVFSMATKGAWVTPNEARQRESLPPIEGGDVLNTKPDTSQNNDSAGPMGRGPEDQTGGEATPPQRGKMRIVFSIADQARQKAMKPIAFTQWLDGNLQPHRAKAMELLGDDSVVTAMVADLQQVASTATPAQLSEYVHQSMTKWECAE